MKWHNENLIRNVESGLKPWGNLVEKVNAKKINLTSIILTTKSSEDQTFFGNLFLGDMIQELSDMMCDLSSEL